MKIYWPLTALLLMFLTPVIAAGYLLYCKDHASFHTVEHGTLIQPAHKLSLTTITPHKWHLIYLKPNVCALECQNRQATLANLHLALGADQQRVILSIKSSKQFELALKDDSILIVNPLGFYIMHYAPEAKLSGLLKDLKRLLKYSHAT